VSDIDADMAELGSLPVVLTNALWMVVTISCWFYTLFLFDTLGDAVGFDGAYWVLIVMPLMPVVLYFAAAVISVRSLGADGRVGAIEKDKEGSSEGVEMCDVVSNPVFAEL
jgi:hypothetical protein